MLVFITTSRDLIENQGCRYVWRQKGKLGRAKDAFLVIRQIDSNSRERFLKGVAAFICQWTGNSECNFIRRQQSPLAWLFFARYFFRDASEQIHIRIRHPAHTLHARRDVVEDAQHILRYVPANRRDPGSEKLRLPEPRELLAGVREIFGETAEYYAMAQSGTIPASMTSEATFGIFYNRLVKRKGDPDASKFVFGTENHALRAEKALFDLAMLSKERPELADYLTCTPAKDNKSPGDSLGRFTSWTALIVTEERGLPPASLATMPRPILSVARPSADLSIVAWVITPSELA